MEWVDAITTLVSNVGFPIAACAFMGWMMYKGMQMMQDMQKESNAALTEMSNAIQELIVKFDDHVNRVE